MKKYIYSLIALSVAGIILSLILLFQHYNPETNMGILSCGTGLINPCLALSQSSFSSLFGIPVAAFGLLFYLFNLFVLLIADYAREKYYTYAVAFLLPLSGIAVVLDLVLAVLLIKSGLACTYCITSYFVNIGLLILFVLSFRLILKETGEKLLSIYKDFFTMPESAPNKKAFLSSFVLFVILLTTSVMAFSYAWGLKRGKRVIPKKEMQRFEQNFYRTKREKLDFLDKGIVLGNPNAPITIVAFTDFLCSACFQFYQTEKGLFSRYRDKIRIVYFNYPLDSLCNEDVKRSVYFNSCIASRAITAANQSGFLEDYLITHFSRYKAIAHGYNPSTAINIFNLLNKEKRKGLDAHTFQKLIASDGVNEIVKDQIEIARDLKINATPTLFIMGRRIVGVPPMEFLKDIIDRELKKIGAD